MIFSLSSTPVEERAGERRCVESVRAFDPYPLSLTLSPRCGARELVIRDNSAPPTFNSVGYLKLNLECSQFSEGTTSRYHCPQDTTDRSTLHWIQASMF